jgi:small conductance mechanosensitive channel
MLFFIALLYLLLNRSIKLIGKRDEVDEHVENTLRLILRICLLFVLISTVFYFFELPTEWFIGSSAIIGAAIGFGSSQTINNFVAGLYIITSSPFRIKDYVKIADIEGQVESISLNYTTLYTPSFNILKIPNTQVMNNRVLNCTHEGFIKYTFSMNFPHNAPMLNEEIISKCIEPAIREFYEEHQDLQLRRPEFYFEESVSFARSFKIRIFIPRGEAKSLYTLQADLSDLIMNNWDKERRRITNSERS